MLKLMCFLLNLLVFGEAGIFGASEEKNPSGGINQEGIINTLVASNKKTVVSHEATTATLQRICNVLMVILFFSGVTAACNCFALISKRNSKKIEKKARELNREQRIAK